MGILDRFKKPGGIKKLVCLLEGTDEKARTNMLAQMRQEDPDFTKNVESKVLIWDDVYALEAKDLQRLLKGFPLRPLATAIFDLDEQKKSIIMQALDKPSQRNLLEERESLGNPTAAMILTSRRKLIQLARELESAGELVVPAAKKLKDAS